MTAQDLLKHEIDGAGFQLKACCNGMPEAAQDEKLCEGGLTPREMLEHLTEAYEAMVKHSRGEQHEWGSYKAPDRKWEALLESLWATRALAASAALDSEDHSKEGFDYIVAHDLYHVGQLALIRVKSDPLWNAYSIYPE